MEPERKTKYSMRVIMLMLNLRKEIQAKNMHINEYVEKIYRLNPAYLNQLELQKIIQSTNAHFESLDLYELYLELKGSEPMIKVQKFYQIYSSVDKMYPHQGKNQVRHEDKDKTRQVQKKMLRLGLMKLERYVKENNFQVLFHECDVDGNGKLDKLEFNKLMIATDIKELGDKNVRKVLIKKIFSYYPNQMMSKQDFMSFFKIKPEDIQKIKEEKERQKERQREKQHQRKAIFQKKPQQGGIKQISFENNQKKIDSPMKKADNPMKKKEMKEPQPIKHTQSQALTEEIIDAGSIFPRAISLYRLGMPAPTELQYLQKLEGYLQANKKFLDHNNPKSNLGEYLHASQIFNGSYHIFQMAASVLNREKSRIGLAREIEPKDIIQGEVGDCYFLSSIASIISFYPEVVSDKILFSSNQAGYYAIKLFIDGEWRIIQTDSRFPCRYGKPVYAKPHGMQIWVMLLEKCWAKVFGSYQSIDSGTPTEGFRAISGAPSEYVSAETQQDHNKLYQQLKEGFEKRHVITASGSKYLSQMSQAEQDKVGLISGHAYSFLKFLKIEGETVVKMRNPWGRKIWQGEWSYESKKWTKQLRDRYNYHFQPDDGSFYIPWNQFIRYFSSFVFCKLNPTYSHTSYRSIIKSDQTKYVRMIVREEGSYNIALYQESKRKNLNNPGYNYSGTRVILMKIDEEKWEYIGSINKQAHCIYFQANLKRGIYLVATKVEWENRPVKHCCLTTYGPDKVDFEKEDRTIAPLFEKSLIESYSKKNSGKLKTYERLKIPEATNETSFSIDTGIGYMKVKNPSDRWFSTTVSMNSAKGIEIIKPDTLPFCFDMQPKTEKVIGFFVSYSGYSYESSESMETKY